MRVELFFAALLIALPLSQAGDFSLQFSTSETGTTFGYGVDVLGDWAIAGERGYDGNKGRAIFYKRNPTTGAFVEHQSVQMPTPVAGISFGWDVALTDGYAAVGAQGESVDSQTGRGAIHVFKLVDDTTWTWQQRVVDPSGAAEEYFSHGMDIDGPVLVGGAKFADAPLTEAGVIVIFERNETTGLYEFAERFGGPAAGSHCGRRAKVSGYTVYSGCYAHNDQGIGILYTKEGGTWSQKQTFTAPTPETNGLFGHSCALIEGDVLVVGGQGLEEMYVYNFNEVGGTYDGPSQTLVGPAGSSFGFLADISDDTLIVSAHVDQTDGRLHVYKRTGGTWTATESLGEAGTTQFSLGAAIDQNTLIVGAQVSRDVFIYTDDTLAYTHDSNPLRCGDYDSTNERYFYDDGTGCESTPTVSDACYYSAGALVTSNPAALRLEAGGTPHSELKADEGTDYIYLAFDLADKYYNHRLVFADAGSGECAHVDWEMVSATRDVTSLDACETTYVYRLPWADAYNVTDSKCGWERDGTGANVKLTLDFAVQAVEDLRTTRAGETLTREVEFSMPVEVEFPTQVTASPVNVTVFAPVRALAVITGQSVTIDEAAVTATLTLDLFTEVQDPFELHAITESTDTLPTGVTLVTAMSGVEDEAVRQDDECTDGSADCANTWRWQYTTPSVSGGSNPCDFDGTYQVTFGVRCSDEAETDCPIDDSTDSVEITLTVSTSNHCPSVIDSVDLNAALAVYDLPARADAQDDFVGDGVEDDGQTADLNDWQVAYFAAPVTSTQVAIQRTEFNQVWIVRHQETVSVADDDVVVLLDADDSIDESPYNNVGEIDCAVVAGVNGADATATAVSAATGCSPAKDGVGGTYSFNFKHGEGGNAVAGGYSTPIFEFDIRTDAAGFNMVDDAIEEMQVNAVIDVEYANAAKRTAGAVQNNAQQSTVTSSFSMQTTGSTTSSSGSTALFGMNATVLYGAGAFLVLAVLGVLVAVSRRRSGNSNKMDKMESTAELTTTVSRSRSSSSSTSRGVTTRSKAPAPIAPRKKKQQLVVRGAQTAIPDSDLFPYRPPRVDDTLYQAAVPPLQRRHPRASEFVPRGEYAHEERLAWDPTRITEYAVMEYLVFAEHLHGAETWRGTVHEHLLTLLRDCEYDVTRAKYCVIHAIIVRTHNCAADSMEEKKAAVEWFQRHRIDPPPDQVQRMRAALQKATGEATIDASQLGPLVRTARKDGTLDSATLSALEQLLERTNEWLAQARYAGRPRNRVHIVRVEEVVRRARTRIPCVTSKELDKLNGIVAFYRTWVAQAREIMAKRGDARVTPTELRTFVSESEPKLGGTRCEERTRIERNLSFARRAMQLVSSRIVRRAAELARARASVRSSDRRRGTPSPVDDSSPMPSSPDEDENMADAASPNDGDDGGNEGDNEGDEGDDEEDEDGNALRAPQTRRRSSMNEDEPRSSRPWWRGRSSAKQMSVEKAAALLRHIRRDIPYVRAAALRDLEQHVQAAKTFMLRVQRILDTPYEPTPEFSRSLDEIDALLSEEPDLVLQVRASWELRRESQVRKWVFKVHEAMATENEAPEKRHTTVDDVQQLVEDGEPFANANRHARGLHAHLRNTVEAARQWRQDCYGSFSKKKKKQRVTLKRVRELIEKAKQLPVRLEEVRGLYDLASATEEWMTEVNETCAKRPGETHWRSFRTIQHLMQQLDGGDVASVDNQDCAQLELLCSLCEAGTRLSARLMAAMRTLENKIKARNADAQASPNLSPEEVQRRQEAMVELRALLQQFDTAPELVDGSGVDVEHVRLLATMELPAIERARQRLAEAIEQRELATKLSEGPDPTSLRDLNRFIFELQCHGFSVDEPFLKALVERRNAATEWRDRITELLPPHYLPRHNIKHRRDKERRRRSGRSSRSRRRSAAAEEEDSDGSDSSDEAPPPAVAEVVALLKQVRAAWEARQDVGLELVTVAEVSSLEDCIDACLSWQQEAREILLSPHVLLTDRALGRCNSLLRGGREFKIAMPELEMLEERSWSSDWHPIASRAQDSSLELIALVGIINSARSFAQTQQERIVSVWGSEQKMKEEMREWTNVFVEGESSDEETDPSSDPETAERLDALLAEPLVVEERYADILRPLSQRVTAALAWRRRARQLYASRLPAQLVCSPEILGKGLDESLEPSVLSRRAKDEQLLAGVAAPVSGDADGDVAMGDAGEPGAGGANGEVDPAAAAAAAEDDEEDAEEEDNQLYCVCKKRSILGELMVQCDACLNWFHHGCLYLSPRDVENRDFVCPDCAEKRGAEYMFLWHLVPRRPRIRGPPIHNVRTALQATPEHVNCSEAAAMRDHIRRAEAWTDKVKRTTHDLLVAKLPRDAAPRQAKEEADEDDDGDVDMLSSQDHGAFLTERMLANRVKMWLRLLRESISIPIEFEARRRVETRVRVLCAIRVAMSRLHVLGVRIEGAPIGKASFDSNTRTLSSLQNFFEESKSALEFDDQRTIVNEVQGDDGEEEAPVAKKRKREEVADGGEVKRSKVEEVVGVGQGQERQGQERQGHEQQVQPQQQPPQPPQPPQPQQPPPQQPEYGAFACYFTPEAPSPATIHELLQRRPLLPPLGRWRLPFETLERVMQAALSWKAVVDKATYQPLAVEELRSAYYATLQVVPSGMLSTQRQMQQLLLAVSKFEAEEKQALERQARSSELMDLLKRRMAVCKRIESRYTSQIITAMERAADWVQRLNAAIDASEPTETFMALRAELESEEAPVLADEEDAGLLDQFTNLYCLCQTHWRSGDPMVCCDFCDNWFHHRCVNLTSEQAATLSKYKCPRCARRHREPYKFGQSVPDRYQPPPPKQASPQKAPVKAAAVAPQAPVVVAAAAAPASEASAKPTLRRLLNKAVSMPTEEARPGPVRYGIERMMLVHSAATYCSMLWTTLQPRLEGDAARAVLNVLNRFANHVLSTNVQAEIARAVYYMVPDVASAALRETNRQYLELRANPNAQSVPSQGVVNLGPVLLARPIAPATSSVDEEAEEWPVDNPSEWRLIRQLKRPPSLGPLHKRLSQLRTSSEAAAQRLPDILGSMPTSDNDVHGMLLETTAEREGHTDVLPTLNRAINLGAAYRLGSGDPSLRDWTELNFAYLTASSDPQYQPVEPFVDVRARLMKASTRSARAKAPPGTGSSSMAAAAAAKASGSKKRRSASSSGQPTKRPKKAAAESNGSAAAAATAAASVAESSSNGASEQQAYVVVSQPTQTRVRLRRT